MQLIFITQDSGDFIMNNYNILKDKNCIMKSTLERKNF